MADRHKPDDRPVSVRLPADLREWLSEAAGRDGHSRSAVIIEAIAEKRAREAAAG